MLLGLAQLLRGHCGASHHRDKAIDSAGLDFIKPSAAIMALAIVQGTGSGAAPVHWNIDAIRRRNKWGLGDHHWGFCGYWGRYYGRGRGHAALLRLAR